MATPAATTNPESAAFGAFALHVAVAAPLIADGLETVSDDALALDIAALTDSSIDLWLDLGDEVDWLAANPPTPCFAATHASYSDAIGLLHQAMDQISDGAILFDVDLLTSGTVLMVQGNAKMQEAAAGVDASAISCG